MASVKKVGRPKNPKGAGSVNISLRIEEGLLDQLKNAAAEKGHGVLSREIMSRLKYSLKFSDRDKSIYALCYLMAELADLVGNPISAQGKPRFDWRTDPFTFEAFRVALGELLDWLKPSGETISQFERYEGGFHGMPASVVENFKSPKAKGQEAFAVLWRKMQSEPLDDEEKGRLRRTARGIRVERQFYAMADARRDLRLTEGDKK
jgi:hypothetical protein